MIFFVTGTDTGIGKTLATAVLAKGFSLLGKKVITQKPIQTGADYPEDLTLHRKLTGMSLDSPELLKLTSPYVFKFPAAPELAARLENQEIDLLQIKKCTEELDRRYDVVLVEGAGGLYVPITRKETILDLISLLMCPVFLVSAARLGTINHTLLSIQALKQKGIFIAGLIYNLYFSGDDVISRESLEDIKRLGEIEHVLLMPKVEGEIPEDLALSAKKFLEDIFKPKFPELLS
ncbi:dethiobiotin synthase [Thermodesulfatator indicus DSM 15286]|uniref:ATP-dependent dethiobiotin synthetase BioD n=1 Tax=Thermodesulfatator indicus (strain DSM 15286 / JCM 11887 / CIR29812) TaxID=667014 RepID=F8ADD4_THEID|nr:dethiobiotin synthase [Thermodesulfatator indicus]AEH45949.1 dethiobiotin synthase [Thermodesulfatator indicus DSM 15286]